MNDDKRDVFKRELDDITTQTTIGEYNNVFVLGNQIWLQDGLTLKKYDESRDRFGETIDVSELIKTSEGEYIKLLGFDYFEGHILGYVGIDSNSPNVNSNESGKATYIATRLAPVGYSWAGNKLKPDHENSFENDSKRFTYTIDESNAFRLHVPNEHSFPLTYIPQMSPNRQSENIKFYFLINPEKPDDIVYLKEDILEQNYAIIRVLGSHFIIENETELKCVNPFTGETKWYISREDVSGSSRILWVDERGVLVQNMINWRLYCFE